DEWRSKGEEAARQLAETVIPKDLVRWEIIAVGEAVRAHMGWQKNSADKKEEKEEPRLFGNVERTDAPATLKTATTNFNRYREWESTVKGMGAEVEADGSGRFVAHINGDSIGEWD